MVLEQLYPEDFRTLLGWLSSAELPEKLADLEAGRGDHSAQLTRWAALEPSLAGLDVGSYLFLAASLSGTTVTEVSIPGPLREIADSLASPSDTLRSAAKRKVRGHPSEDRRTLSRHLADLIRVQPGRQHELAESLMAVIGDDEDVAASAVPSLRRIPHQDIGPALPITVYPPGGGLACMAKVLSAWQESDGVSEDTRRAARVALRRRTS